MIERPGLWHPLIKQGIGELLALSRATTHKPVQFSAHYDMREASYIILISSNTGLLKHRHQFQARQLLPAL